MLNPYFNHPNVHGSRNERRLINDLTRECIQIYGRTVYYIPRRLGKEDKILGEDSMSTFTAAFPLEMYVESRVHHEGPGDVLSKFGLGIPDQFTFTVSQERFKQELQINNISLVGNRPNEGDLLYFDLANPDNPNTELYEIIFVEHEKPHYQISELTLYQIKCEKFKYSNEKFETGIPELDKYSLNIGVDKALYRVRGTSGEWIELVGGGYLDQSTPWHNEIQPSRTYADNDRFQEEVLDIVEFNTETPFGVF